MDTFPNIHLECDFGDDKLKIMDAVDDTQFTDLDQEFLGAVCVALTILKKKVSDEKKANPKKYLFTHFI